jgi:hypothetical protein
MTGLSALRFSRSGEPCFDVVKKGEISYNDRKSKMRR